MRNCPNCNSEPSILHPIYGILIGIKCQKKRETQQSPGSYIEFTSDDIKRQRVDYADDILKPYRSGEVSKRYIQKYGIKGIEVTEKEVKKAMDNSDVWSGESNSYYRE